MISIVIPLRETESPDTTLDSLSKQNFKDYKTIIVKDGGKGANYARNLGFSLADTEYVLFSDNDIVWRENGINKLIETLDNHPEADYAYGAYYFTNTRQTLCDRPFDAKRLKQSNYISTMSLVRWDRFLGFDEKIVRFQDWDAWLTMLDAGRVGVYCGEIIFETEFKGYPHTDEETIEYENIVKRKHGII